MAERSITLLLLPLLLVPLTAMALLAACSGEQTPRERVLKRGELRLVTRNSATTYYLGREGPRGIEYDLAKGFAEQLGLELVVTQAFTLDELFIALDRGEADIAGAGLTLTPARAAGYAPSTSYATQRPQVIYKAGERRPRRIEQLEGLSIVVLAGSSHEAELEVLHETYPFLRWEAIEASDPMELLLRVNADSADVAVVDSRDFFVQQTLVPRLAVAFDLAKEQDIVWYLPDDVRDSEWQTMVDGYLATQRNEGNIAALSTLYFDRDASISRIDSQTFMNSVRKDLQHYQLLIQQVAQEHQLPWELLAAISYQESHWDPRAISPTGVKGMMMLTLATAREMGLSDRTDPAQSLRGGARYFKELRRRLPNDIMEPDRSWLALAAYNIGMGHLEDARVLSERSGGDPHLWNDVMDALPLLEDARHHSTVRYGYARGLEAVRYVQNIRHYYNILRWQTAQDARPLPPSGLEGLLPERILDIALYGL